MKKTMAIVSDVTIKGGVMTRKESLRNNLENTY